MKTRPDLSCKPWYRCLICPRFRKICGGRPTRGMDLTTWCEYIGDVMDYFGLSIQWVAAEAGVSEATVERIKYRRVGQDFMRGTTRLVEQVVLGYVGEHLCYLDTGENAAQVAKLLEKVESLRKEKERLEKIIDRYLE